MALSDYSNIHKGEDIYVIASGATLGYIDKSFFDNKITVGVNQVYKFVDTKYLVRKETKFAKDVFQEAKKETIHFISKGNCGSPGTTNQQFRAKNIIVFDHNPNRSTIPDTLPQSGLVVSHSTITSAIHLAAVMGAKNIILVGHDCGTLDGEPNVKNYHTDKSRSQGSVQGYKGWLKTIEKDTIKLRGILKKMYNVNIYSLNPFVNIGLENHSYSR